MKTVPILITIVNGVVDEAIVCKSQKHLEELFEEEVKAYGIDINNTMLEDGYVELEDATICMFLAELRR